MCFKSYRCFILVIAFVYNVSLQLISRNIVFAMQGMENHTYAGTTETQGINANMSTCIVKERKDAVTDGPYKWEAYIEPLVLTVSAVGLFFGTLGAIFVYDYCYLRPILSLALIWSGLLNIFGPEITSAADFNGLIISRFAIGLYVGLVYPTANIVCSNWFLPEELNMAITISFLGMNVGSVLFAFAGPINVGIGWEALFIIPGCASVFSGLLVLVFYTDQPRENIWIGPEEEKLLEDCWNKSKGVVVGPPMLDTMNTLEGKLGDKAPPPPLPPTTATVQSVQPTLFGTLHVGRHHKNKSAPLCAALTYFPVWGVLIGHFGVAWLFEATFNYTQIYMVNIHGLSLSEVSFLNSVPTNLSMTTFGLALSQSSEWCIRNNYVSKLTVRRVGAVLCMCASMYFIFLGYLPCDQVRKYIVPLLIFSSLRAGLFISVYPSTIDISPTHQKTLFTCNMVISNVPGFIVPQIMHALGTHSIESWRTTFLMTIGVVGFSLIFYIVALSDQVQGFDSAAAKSLAPSIKKLSSSEMAAIADSKEVSSARGEFKPASPEMQDRVQKSWTENNPDIVVSIWDMDQEPAVIQFILDHAKQEEDVVEQQKRPEGTAEMNLEIQEGRSSAPPLPTPEGIGWSFPWSRAQSNKTAVGPMQSKKEEELPPSMSGKEELPQSIKEEPPKTKKESSRSDSVSSSDSSFVRFKKSL